MKNLIPIFLISLLSSCVMTKPLQFNYRDCTVEKEIQSIKSKNELFVIANSWLVETFDNATNVIQFSDKEEGMIKGRYLVDGTIYPKSHSLAEIDKRIFAIITVQVKDKLTKITIAPQGEGTYSELNIMDPIFSSTGSPSPEKIKYKVNSLITDYEIYLSNYKKW